MKNLDAFFISFFPFFIFVYFFVSLNKSGE